MNTDLAIKTILFATGSEAYQMPSAAGTSQTSSFVLRDVDPDDRPVDWHQADLVEAH
jgi:hypothetical protein